MKQITYEETMRKDHICILVGEEIDKLKCRDKRNEAVIQCVKDKVAIPFSRINKALHRELECMEYIRIWSKIKIYKVVEEV